MILFLCKTYNMNVIDIHDIVTVPAVCGVR